MPLCEILLLVTMPLLAYLGYRSYRKTGSVPGVLVDWFGIGAVAKAAGGIT